MSLTLVGCRCGLKATSTLKAPARPKGQWFPSDVRRGLNKEKDCICTNMCVCVSMCVHGCVYVCMCVCMRVHHVGAIISTIFILLFIYSHVIVALVQQHFCGRSQPSVHCLINWKVASERLFGSLIQIQISECLCSKPPLFGKKSNETK